MGTTAARKCSWIIQNVFSVLGFELFTACQAVDLRKQNEEDNGLSKVQNAVYERVREDIPFIAEDREMRIEIEKMERLIRSGELLSIVSRFIADYR